MNFQQLHKQRKVIIIGAALGLIACFLPWFSYGLGSINGMNGIGVLAFVLFIAAGLLALAGDQKANIPPKMWLPVLGAGAVNICIIGYLIIRWESAMSGASSAESSVFGSVGLSFGIWAAIVGAVLITYGAYRFRSAENNLKDSLRSLKNDVDKAIADKGKDSNTTPPHS
ncbi:MAG: hypothetical protein JST47_10420 [Bacteroidetes bacterium]|nr:hypothetical protein [Bacteroidota bacterium]MBS1974561.1 hypothetical protein [Bacteroidota bacterium]